MAGIKIKDLNLSLLLHIANKFKKTGRAIAFGWN
jgi:hypothetical protein